MRIRKPIAVDILNHRVKIYYVKVIEKDPDLEGVYYKKKKIIKVVNNPQWREHLFHEVCHAVLNIGGLDVHLEDDQEEAIVQAIEAGVCPLFSIDLANPGWVYR